MPEQAITPQTNSEFQPDPNFTSFEASLATQFIGMQDQYEQGEVATSSDVVHELGHGAVEAKGVEVDASQVVSLDGIEGVAYVNPERPTVKIIPSGLDKLGPGSYLDVQGQVFQVTENKWGKRVDANAFGSEELISVQTPGAESIFSALGFSFDSNTRDEWGRLKPDQVPTPETLKNRAAELGIELELFASGAIQSKEFLQIFGAGKFPVATGDGFYYQHDTNDDHLTAIVLGGDVLREALAKVAQQALETGDAVVIGDMAGRIDNFTGTITAELSKNGQIIPYKGDYGVEAVGNSMGLTDEEVASIRTAIEVSMKKWGITKESKQAVVKKLDPDIEDAFY